MTSIEEFDYELPSERIAQTPIEPRDAAKLLDATGDSIVHRRVRDLPALIRPGDVMVVNDTRVIRARLALTKPSGGAVEVLLLEPHVGADGDEGGWRALVKPSRRVRPGTPVVDAAGEAVLVVEDDLGEGVRVVHSATDETVLAHAERIGAVPLPPYITTPLVDGERYQTIYGREERSVAAPTAGLHLTRDVLDAVERAGAELHRVDLAVGLGTFRPILVGDVAEHQMHGERFEVDPEVLEACRSAERVIAIGTTTVRALESAATFGIDDGVTELFISPGYEWKLVDVLLTNFHQPRSSLLVMLAAFAGPRWRQVYAEALAEDYRFLSFGDAMIIGRGNGR